MITFLSVLVGGRFIYVVFFVKQVVWNSLKCVCVHVCVDVHLCQVKDGSLVNDMSSSVTGLASRVSPSFTSFSIFLNLLSECCFVSWTFIGIIPCFTNI